MNTNTIVKERPILFSAPMVRAILEGRKTQTRRVVKDNSHKWYLGSGLPGDGVPCMSSTQQRKNGEYEKRYPYGRPGDRLWVRETWRCNGGKMFESQKNKDQVFYLATCAGRDVAFRTSWRPSIFMPRWASRIDLEVVNVRVERLQDISEEDAKAEGVEYDQGWEEQAGEGHEGGWGFLNYLADEPEFTCKSARESFKTLIEKIRGRGRWDANPWVWVIEFKRLRP